MAGMRGDDRDPGAMFSYVSAEQRVPRDHPLRAIRTLVDDVLRDMSREFDGLYARVGRPSIPPERLLRAQLLQIFYSIRSERLLMEQLDYNLVLRKSNCRCLSTAKHRASEVSRYHRRTCFEHRSPSPLIYCVPCV
jgi:transposase